MKTENVRKRWWIAATRLTAAVIILTGLGALPQRVARAGPMVLFVKPMGSGWYDCGSWDNACTLDYALSLDGSGYQIWAMEGLYKPTTTTDRSISFVIKDGFEIDGGFDGSETTFEGRDYVNDKTILSGDIGNLGEIPDNSYHVVSSTNTDATAVLDGVWITAGNANGSSGTANSYGGGLYISNGSPTLRHVTFSQNHATLGGGMYSQVGHPHLTDVLFLVNYATSGGGFYASNSTPQIESSTFQGNNATSTGGGMGNSGCTSLIYHASLNNVTFITNFADHGGGGMRNSDCDPNIESSAFINNESTEGGGGGMENYNSSPTLVNVTFSGNSAAMGGGGMKTFNASLGDGDPILTNVTFYNNSAGIANSIANNNSNPVITNSILWGSFAPDDVQVDNYNSTPVITYSDVEGGYTGTGNIRANPLLGSLNYYNGATKSYPLLPGSPAIDTANSAFGVCPSYDQRGVERPRGLGCDMGAYESRGFSLIYSSGKNQLISLLMPFPYPLVVNVISPSGEPVNGGKVYFSLPSGGPGASPTSDAATVASGQASMTFTANGRTGVYHIYFYTTYQLTTPVDFPEANWIDPDETYYQLYLPLLRK